MTDTLTRFRRVLTLILLGVGLAPPWMAFAQTDYTFPSTPEMLDTSIREIDSRESAQERLLDRQARINNAANTILQSTRFDEIDEELTKYAKFRDHILPDPDLHDLLEEREITTLPNIVFDSAGEEEQNAFQEFLVTALLGEVTDEEEIDPDPGVFCGLVEEDKQGRGDGGSTGSSTAALLPRYANLTLIDWDAMVTSRELPGGGSIPTFEEASIAIIDSFDIDALRSAVNSLRSIGVGALTQDQLEVAFTQGDYSSTLHGNTVVMHLVALLRALWGLSDLNLTAGAIQGHQTGNVYDEIRIDLPGGATLLVGIFSTDLVNIGADVLGMLEDAVDSEYRTANLSWTLVPCSAEQILERINRDEEGNPFPNSYTLMDYLVDMGSEAYRSAPEFFEVLFEYFTGEDGAQLAARDDFAPEEFAAVVLQLIWSAYLDSAISDALPAVHDDFQIYGASGNQGLVFSLLPAAFPDVVCVSAQVAVGSGGPTQLVLEQPVPNWANYGEVAQVGGYFPLGADTWLPVNEAFYWGTTYSTILAALMRTGHGNDPFCGW